MLNLSAVEAEVAAAMLELLLCWCQSCSLLPGGAWHIQHLPTVCAEPLAPTKVLFTSSLLPPMQWHISSCAPPSPVSCIPQIWGLGKENPDGLELTLLTPC